MQGKIIKGIAGFYYVYGENEVLYECKAKGIFRKAVSYTHLTLPTTSRV